MQEEPPVGRDDARFCWHSAARVFSGDAEIARAPHTEVDGLAAIPAKPGAVQALATAVLGRRAFCVHAGVLPAVNLAQGQFLTLTGGSSGAPKVVQRSQASWISSFHENARLFAYRPEDKLAVLGSLSHSLALYGLLEAMHLGLNAFVLDTLSPRQQRQVIRKRQINILYLTPTQLRLLAKGRQMPSVRLILCGGGALDPATRAQAQQTFPQAQILVFYGSAETSFVSIGDADTPQGAVGRPYPGVTLEIRDQTGRTTAGSGEIWVKSPYHFHGYANPVQDGAVWDKGYLSVGELGHLDQAGHLWITGRKSRAINIADKLVHPEEIEAFLTSVAALPQAVVLAVDDGMRGARLALVLEGAADPQTATRARDACLQRFGPGLTPRRILFHPELPLLASGKPDLAALARWLEDQP